VPREREHGRPRAARGPGLLGAGWPAPDQVAETCYAEGTTIDETDTMTSFEAEIEIVEDGFFHPLVRAEQDLVDAHQFRHVGVVGLSNTVQFVRTKVRVGATEPASDDLVVWAHYPRMSDDDVTRTASVLRSAFPDTSITFVLDVALLERGGDVYQANIEAWNAEAREALRGVSAVCAAQCWGTLADVESVSVRLDGVLYSARMRPRAATWLAFISIGHELPQV